MTRPTTARSQANERKPPRCQFDEVAVLWHPSNENLSAAKVLAPLVERWPRLAVYTPSSRRESDDLVARFAAGNGARLLVTAGGDGTINAVVNALLRRDANVTLAILPCGTGNDLARTLGVPLDPAAAAAALPNWSPRALDVIHYQSNETHRAIANMAAGGNSARVGQQITDEQKQRLGPLAYPAQLLGVLADLDVFQVQLRCDDQRPIVVDSVSILLANGRTVGGGAEVAPAADPSDGWIEVIVVRDGGVLDLAALAAQWALTDYLASEQVVYRQARRVELAVSPTAPFSLDGETMDVTTAQFQIAPHALRVLAPAGPVGQ